MEQVPVSNSRPPGIQKIARGVSLGDDGIWYAERRGEISYPADGNQTCFQLEDRSYWFNHRNRCIVAAVRQFPPPSDSMILDVGGGNGFVSLALQNAGYSVALLEPGMRGARNAMQRGLRDVICATVQEAGIEPGAVGAVGLFDVVEHIEDDVGFLRHIRSRLPANGRVYLTVPTYRWLWSNEDELSGHYRRHTRKTLTDTLVAAGFELLYSTYIFRWLPLPIFLLRALPYRLGRRTSQLDAVRVQNQHGAGNAGTTDLLLRLLASEIGRIESGRSLAFGSSLLAVARPKDES